MFGDVNKTYLRIFYKGALLFERQPFENSFNNLICPNLNGHAPVYTYNQSRSKLKNTLNNTFDSLFVYKPLKHLNLKYILINNRSAF